MKRTEKWIIIILILIALGAIGTTVYFGFSQSKQQKENDTHQTIEADKEDILDQNDNKVENEDDESAKSEDNTNEQETCEQNITGNSVYDKELYELCKEGYLYDEVYVEIEEAKFGFGEITNKEEHLEDYGSQLIQYLGMESTLDTIQDYEIENIVNGYVGCSCVKKEVILEAYYQIFGERTISLDYIFERSFGVSENFICTCGEFGNDLLVEFKEKEILADKALLKYEVTDLFSENKDKHNVLLTLTKDGEQYHFKSTEIID